MNKMDVLLQMPPLAVVFVASLFTWGLTTLGAAVVFCFKDVPKRTLDVMLGTSAGIMLAAALWSLILPAISLTATLENQPWWLPILGFLTGGFFIIITSELLDRKLPPSPGKNRSMLLVIAMTLHNIPEGLAVGVAFSGFALGIEHYNIWGTIMFVLGIGIQNFPDGLAVSVPLYREGYSKTRAFFWGQASGAIEPIAAILGFLITVAINGILPFFLTFAAGAMLAVIIGELIPSINQESKSSSTIGFLIGFTSMMVLDLLLSS